MVPVGSNLRYQASVCHHLNTNWRHEWICAIQHWNKTRQVLLFNATLHEKEGTKPFRIPLGKDKGFLTAIQH